MTTTTTPNTTPNINSNLAIAAGAVTAVVAVRFVWKRIKKNRTAE